MLKLNSEDAHIKYKKIPAPSMLFYWEDTSRDRPTIQLDLLKKFGDVVRMPSWFNCFAINHPDYVRHIFQTNFENYIKSDINYNGLIDLIGSGIVTNNGPEWKLSRQNFLPLFQTSFLQQYSAIIVKHTEALIPRWQDFAARGKKFNINEEFKRLTIGIFGEAFLNERFSENFIQEIIRFGGYLNRYSGLGLHMLRLLPLPTVARARLAKASIEKQLSKIIAKRRKLKTQPRDLIGVLLSTPLTEQQMLDELKTMLVASFETISQLMGWTWYNLMKHPNALSNTHHDLQQVLQGKAVTIEDLDKLQYPRMVIEESLRLYPPAWMITRTTVANDVIDGYKIPGKANILICPYALHRHPDYWYKPDNFIPERFTEEAKKDRHRFCFIPFGVGPRMCIAGGFAMMESQLILSTLLPHFDLTFTNKKIKLLAHLTLGAKNGLWAKAYPR